MTCSLITLAQYETRTGEQVADPLLLDALLADASALIRDIAGDELDPVPAAIVPLVVSIVRRALANPIGYNSERLGEWSGTTHRTEAGVSATPDEQRRIRRAVGGAVLGGVELTADMPLSRLDYTGDVIL